MPAKSANPYYSPQLVVVVLIAVIGLIAGLLLLSRPQLLRPKAATANAILSLTADKTSLVANDVVTVTVGLNPSNQPVVGVDAIVNFNTAVLNLTDVQVNTSSGFKTFVPLVTNSNTFDVASVKTAANSSGAVKFGAAAFDLNTQTVDTPVSTVSSNVARLVFQVKPTAPSGSSPISFLYTASRATTDSNVVITNAGTTNPPEDILAQPTALSLSISTAATNTPAPGVKPGDANGDGKVDLIDYGIFLQYYKKPISSTAGPEVGNFNYPTDHTVDLIDYGIFLANYKK